MFKFTILLIATCFAVCILPATQINFKKNKLGKLLVQTVPQSNNNLNQTNRIKLKAKQAKLFAINNHLNTNIAFLVDMQIHCGKPRFFVYNLKSDSIIASGLVTHGSGLGSSYLKPHFGNTVGCLSTSLGFYRVGLKYSGKFGTAYKLHGLESTNSKAFERSVVLHSHTCVPATTSYPLPICMSYGCPTVAPSFLKSIEPILDNVEMPVVLSIYN